MKWFLGILVSLAVGVLLAAKFYVPNRFHHFVHQELLKDTTTGKVFKVINSNNQQTVITTDKATTTITSVTELNPLNNYVLFESKDVQDLTKITSAKITYELVGIKEFRINVLFTDVERDGFSLTKPLLSLSTPLQMGLIKSADKKLYLATNLQIAFSAEKLKYTLDKGTGEISSILVSFTSKTSNDPDILNIVGQFAAKELSTQGIGSISGKFNDVNNVLTIESFKISGFKDLMKKDESPAAAADVPLAMKAMGLIPKIETLVTIPFKISIVSNATHASGKMPMHLELNIKNANIMEPDAYSLKAGISMSYELLKGHVIEIMSVTLAHLQGKDFSHPDFSDANRPKGDDISLLMKFEQDKTSKLISVFQDFLNQTNEAKQAKTEVILQKALEMGLLKKDGDIYAAEFVMENMSMSLNGKTNYKEELAQTIPQTEIDAFLVSNGYVSLVALANGPKKQCYTLLPGFPKTNGTLATKEGCLTSCEGLASFCLTNPNEKHLCYLYQCSWDAEVLSFKNSSPVPTEKMLITKHMAEVKAKLKSLQRIK